MTIYNTYFTDTGLDGKPTTKQGQVEVTETEIRFKADDSFQWFTIGYLDPNMPQADRAQMMQAFAHGELVFLRDRIQRNQKRLNAILKKEGSPRRFVLDYDEEGFPTKGELIDLLKDLR